MGEKGSPSANTLVKAKAECWALDVSAEPRKGPPCSRLLQNNHGPAPAQWQVAGSCGDSPMLHTTGPGVPSSAVLPVLDSGAFHEPSFTPPPAQLSLPVATALQDPLLSARALHSTATWRKLDCLGRERPQKSREGRSEPWRCLFLVNVS